MVLNTPLSRPGKVVHFYICFSLFSVIASTEKYLHSDWLIGSLGITLCGGKNNKIGLPHEQFQFSITSNISNTT